MSKLRLVCATLLALPLLVFGGNHFLALFEMAPAGSGPGVELLESMRSGGLMTWIAVSHLVIGFGLLVPRLRFAAGLMQLPLSLGIVAFHVTMLPEGNGPAIGLLVLNLIVVSDTSRIDGLFAPRY